MSESVWPANRGGLVNKRILLAMMRLHTHALCDRGEVLRVQDLGAADMSVWVKLWIMRVHDRLIANETWLINTLLGDLLLRKLLLVDGRLLRVVLIHAGLVLV